MGLYLDEFLTGMRLCRRTVRVLDIAPAAPLGMLIKKRARELGVEICYRTADLLAEGVDDRVDVMNMVCYEPGTFDLVICSHVLEHVKDDRRAMKEICRVLRHGGKAVLVVPILMGIEGVDEETEPLSGSERIRRFGQSDHVRAYSRGGFIARLADAGFTVRCLGREYFGPRQYSLCAITATSVLYVAQKPVLSS